jgi:hypothetical protein
MCPKPWVVWAPMPLVSANPASVASRASYRGSETSGMVKAQVPVKPIRRPPPGSMGVLAPAAMDAGAFRHVGWSSIRFTFLRSMLRSREMARWLAPAACRPRTTCSNVGSSIASAGSFDLGGGAP